MSYAPLAARLLLACCASLALPLSLTGCNRDDDKAKAEKTENDPAWAKHVAAHTAGAVSRTAPITVRFVKAVGTPDTAMPKGLLEFTPELAGTGRFLSAEELVFTPAAALVPGAEYKVRLMPKKLAGLPRELGPFHFAFSVLEANYEVAVSGLEADADGGPTMTLTGTVATADGEDPAAVEKLLTATFDGRALPIEWAHYDQNRTHPYTVRGIERRDATGSLTLKWDGSAIGVKTSGERVVEVPKLGLFEVSNVEVVREEQQTVRVRFSDLLDTSQNLAGLVTLVPAAEKGKPVKKGAKVPKLGTRIDGNSLLVSLAGAEGAAPGALAGEYALTVDAALRSSRGKKLEKPYETTVSFAAEKPQLRFVGTGTILPKGPTLAIPFEAMNAQSVQVTAFEVYDSKMGQFLQANTLNGNSELERVGRHLWRRTLKLGEARPDRWNRYTLDATELLKAHPGALLRLTLTLDRGDARVTCSPAENAVPPAQRGAPQDYEDYNDTSASGWDGIAQWFDGGDGDEEGSGTWADRENPCTDAYYRYADAVKAERNFIASDLGLLAKRGLTGALDVAVTRLSDAQPLAGAEVEVRNYQDRLIGKGSTGPEGLLRLETRGTPFYLVARTAGEVGYLKLSKGTALPVSHFDTGGETVAEGLKGFLYGERGVWRPGDDIHLSFLLQDKEGRLPANHPVTVQLSDPQGKLVASQTSSQPVGGFYTFTLKTADDALTGNYTARARLGGAEFTRTIKVETVMPNRLKVDFEVAGGALQASAMPAKATLASQWLTGASAGGLNADVTVKLRPVPTRFGKLGDFQFDDATRSFSADRSTVWEGVLGADGKAAINLNLATETAPPGQLEADFVSRVFDGTGAFSTSQQSLPYSPFTTFVGLKTPKGDAVRKMLLTDVDHPLEIATVDGRGEYKDGRVKLSLYKIAWKWWWEQGDGSAAEFSANTEQTLLKEGEVATVGGRAIWKFQVKYPDWGRYLIRACDAGLPEAKAHCSIRVFYMDWPGWAGRAQEEAGPAASALQFFADKPEYAVGETARLQLPDASQGRALFTVENGSKVLSAKWVVFEPGKPAKLDVPITAEMSPTAYAAITLVQPHTGKNNDRPIRLYGVIPLKVSDPGTKLAPTIRSDDLWRPDGEVSFEVREAAGKAMDYTVAVVDEGLLGLTNHKTPDPHGHFFQREALGVATWDLFDEVAGAYGAQLERLLALGGDSGGPIVEKQEQKRFPPVVKFLGAFRLEAGATGRHKLRLPQYVGAVRIMVVAGTKTAYGAAEKTVTVRDPVSVLATLPRVLGPGETLRIPVSVFAFEPQVRSVRLTASGARGLTLENASTTLSFDKPGEQIAFFDARVGAGVGSASFTVKAEAGSARSETTLNIPLRAQNPAITKITRQQIAPGAAWSPALAGFGVPGSGSARLEVSAVPPFGLEQRLAYLIAYPHGCVEQLTSASFPQIYLPGLARLSPAEEQRVAKNVAAGIGRLGAYQQGSGSFAYWPGQPQVNDWADNYAGHFLLEARRLGHHVPAAMLDGWLAAQRERAKAWTAGSGGAAENQAYRLYTLALADKPEVASMNRLREQPQLPPLARWHLASAYARIGLGEAAADIAQGTLDARPDYERPGETFGSAVRDRAVLLDTLLLLKDERRAAPLAQELSAALGSEAWYSTQTTAYSLMALAHRYLAVTAKPGFAYELRAGKAKPQTVSVTKQVVASEPLPESVGAGETLTVTNPGKAPLWATVVQRGSPAPGQETASAEGLKLAVDWRDAKGNPLDPARLAQGLDFYGRVTVTNAGTGPVDDLALTLRLPSGWEITSQRGDLAPITEPPLPPGKLAVDETPARRGNATKPPEFVDVRDDRVNHYFGLKAGETRRFDVRLNASYLGRYYLPAALVESMYDAGRHANTAGQWVEVVKP